MIVECCRVYFTYNKVIGDIDEIKTSLAYNSGTAGFLVDTVFFLQYKNPVAMLRQSVSQIAACHPCPNNRNVIHRGEFSGG